MKILIRWKDQFPPLAGGQYQRFEQGQWIDVSVEEVGFLADNFVVHFNPR